MEYLFSALNYIDFYINKNFFLNLVLFFSFLLIYFTLGIPGGLVFIAATGYFFGIYIGFIICILALTIGSLFFLIFARLFFKKVFPIFFLKTSSKVSNYISESSFEYLIIFRMIPGPPLLLQNFCLSLTNISFVKFFFATFIGFSPIIFITIFIGHQLNNIEKVKNISLNTVFTKEFLLFLLLIIILLGIRIYLKKRN